MKKLLAVLTISTAALFTACGGNAPENKPAANAKPANAEANKPAENTNANTATPAATPNMADTAWLKSPKGLEVKSGQSSYVCPANGKGGQVWGTDMYTADSSICEAAVHAGVITREKGGKVNFEMKPGQKSYKGSDRNGVNTGSWQKFDSSFAFVK